MLYQFSSTLDVLWVWNKKKEEKMLNPLRQLDLEGFPHLVMVVPFATCMNILVTVCTEPQDR